MSLRVAVLALTLASAAPAFAQDPMSHVADVGGSTAGGHGGHRGAMKACQADRQAYCAGIEKGGGRIMQCMKAHAGQLSAGCKSALEEMRAERQAAKGK